METGVLLLPILLILDVLAEARADERDMSVGTEVHRSCKTHDCNTFSEIDGTIYHINCSISSDEFRRGVCDAVNRPKQGTPSRAVHIRKTKEWYTYIHNDEVKLALNFSWKPGQDSSIRSVLKYYLTVTPVNSEVADLTHFEKCLSVHTQLQENQHKNAEFFYECYGLERQTEVMPGTRYFISIQSLPGQAIETFYITVPRCNNKGLSDVTYCVESMKPLYGNVEKVFCSNRSIKYSYSVPKKFGDFASVVFCEHNSDSIPYLNRSCKNNLQEFHHLRTHGTLYNVSLDSSANLSIGYSILLQGNADAIAQKFSTVNFSVCPLPTHPLPAGTLAVSSAALIAITVMGVIVALGCCYVLRRRTSCCQSTIMVSIGGSGNLSSDIPLLPQKRTVYVVFADDDDLHVNVVNAFCQFLMGDLGLQVINHLWEQNVVAKHRIRYMMDKFDEADKVLIVFSKETRNALSENDIDNDNMYSWVMDQAVTQMATKKPDKCLLMYFDYSSPKDIPKQFSKNKKRYRLMKEINQLFCDLNDVEQVQKGRKLKIQKIEDYFIRDKHTQHAQDLYRAIEEMKGAIATGRK